MSHPFATAAGRRRILNGLMAGIEDAIPKGYGAALLIFEYGDGPDAAYVSTAQRADTVKALREQADSLEQHQDFPHQERN